MAEENIDTNKQGNADSGDEAVIAFDEQLDVMKSKIQGTEPAAKEKEGDKPAKGDVSDDGKKDKGDEGEKKKPEKKTKDDEGELEIEDFGGVMSRSDKIKLAAEKKVKEEADAAEKKKQEEATNDEIPSEIKDASESVQDNWKKAIAKREELKKSNLEKDARIAELEKQAGESSLDSPEYKKLLTEHTEMAKTLEQTNYRDSPAFHKKFGNPIKEMSKSVQRYLDDVKSDVKAEELLAKADGDLGAAASSIAENMDEMTKAEFFKLMGEYKVIRREGNSALENHDESRKADVAQGRFDQEKAFSEVSDLIKSSGDVLIEACEPDDPDNPEDVKSANIMNVAIQNLEKYAREITQANMSEKQIAVVAYDAALQRVFKEGIEQRQNFEHKELGKKYNKLVGRYNKLLGKNPNLNQGGEGDPGGSGDGKPKPSGDAQKDFDSALSKMDA